MKKTALMLATMFLLGCPEWAQDRSKVTKTMEAVLRGAQFAITLFGGSAEQRALEKKIVDAALVCLEESSVTLKDGLGIARVCNSEILKVLPPGLPQAISAALGALLASLEEFRSTRPVPSPTARAAATVPLTKGDLAALPKIREEAARLRAKLP